MKRLIKISLLLLSTSLISLYFILQSSWVYLNYIVPRIENYTGAKIKMTSLDITPWRELTVKDLSIKDSKGVVNKIHELKLHYQFLPIFSKEIVIDEVSILNSNLNLNALLNLFSKDNSSKEMGANIGYKIKLKEVSLKNGEFTVPASLLQIESAEPINLRNIDIELRDISSNTEGNFKLKLSLKKLSFFGEYANSPPFAFLTNGEFSLNEKIEFIGESKLTVTKDNLLLGDLNHKGSLLISDDSNILDGELHSSVLELDQLLALIPKKKEASSTKSKASNFTANLKVNLDLVSYNNIKLTKASSDIHFGDSLISGENLLMNINNAPLKGSFILSTIEPLFKPTIDLDIRNLELHPIVKAFNEKASTNLYGDIKRLTFRIKNSWEKKDKGLKERDGDLRATFTNLKIPAYLQDTPPINLLFLPVKALEYVTDQIGSAFLPESITKATKTVDIETRSGQIEFNEAQVRGLINGKGITLSNTKFNSNVLPTLHLNGNIDFNEDLNLAMGIEVLQVPIPLPVTGTLSLPLPDLVGFLPAIVQSLGTSMTNITGLLDSDEEKEKEFFGD